MKLINIVLVASATACIKPLKDALKGVIASLKPSAAARMMNAFDQGRKVYSNF